jgi:RNA polymerase sigma-70 factor (ECF subfamily)
MIKTPTAQDDEDLLRLMSRGDEDAFALLYSRRQGPVYRFAYQMSGSRTLAEDVTQEVFMALIRDPNGFVAEKGTVAGYLYGIARNQVLRRLERDRFLVPIGAADDDNVFAVEQADTAEDPLATLTRNETVESVRSAVLALPPHYREVIVFCELHEMSYAETAAALNCAVGTVRSRLHRARAMLLEKLKSTKEIEQASNNPGTARCFA